MISSIIIEILLLIPDLSIIVRRWRDAGVRKKQWKIFFVAYILLTLLSIIRINFSSFNTIKSVILFISFLAIDLFAFIVLLMPSRRKI